MRSDLLFVLISMLLSISCSTNEVIVQRACDYVQLEEITGFKMNVSQLEVIEFDKALKIAQKSFKKGKCIPDPENHFRRYSWTWSDPDIESENVFSLFNGTDYIISRDVIVILDDFNMILEVRPYSWGR